MAMIKRFVHFIVKRIPVIAFDVILFLMFFTGTGRIFNPFLKLMVIPIAKEYVYDKYDKGIKIESIETGLVHFLYDSNIHVNCRLKDNPEINICVYIDVGDMYDIYCNYDGAVFVYCENRDFKPSLLNAIGDDVNYNINWIYGDDGLALNDHVLNYKEVEKFTLSDFEESLEGCDIYVYTNTKLTKYEFNYNGIFEFIEFYKESLPNIDGRMIFRIRSDDGFSSYEKELIMSEINSVEDVMAKLNND